jgi:hypothetical protein
MWKSSLTSHEVGHSRRATEADRRASAPLVSHIALAKERRAHRTNSAHAHYTQGRPDHLAAHSRFFHNQDDAAMAAPHNLQHHLPSMYVEQQHQHYRKPASPEQHHYLRKGEPLFAQPRHRGRNEQLERPFIADEGTNTVESHSANQSHPYLPQPSQDGPSIHAPHRTTSMDQSQTYMGRASGIGSNTKANAGQVYYASEQQQQQPQHGHPSQVLNSGSHYTQAHLRESHPRSQSSQQWSERVISALPQNSEPQNDRNPYAPYRQTLVQKNSGPGSLPSRQALTNHNANQPSLAHQAAQDRTSEMQWHQMNDSRSNPGLPSVETLSRTAHGSVQAPSHSMADVVHGHTMQRQELQRPAMSPTCLLTSPKPSHSVLSPVKTTSLPTPTTVWGSSWSDRGDPEGAHFAEVTGKVGHDVLPSMSGSGTSTSPHGGSVGSSLGSPGLISSPVPPPMLPLVEAAVAPRRPRCGPRLGSALLPPLPNVTPAAPPQHIDLGGLIDDDANVPLPSLGSASTSPVVALSPGSGNLAGFRFSPMPISPLQPFSAIPGHGEDVMQDAHYSGQGYSARSKHGTW